MLFFRHKYLEHVICALTSKELEHPLIFGKFLCYIGIWYLLTPFSAGSMDRKSFWTNRPPSRRRGEPHRFNDLMSSKHFEDITSVPTFTDHKAPTYKDKFWEVRQMIDEFNKNMKEVSISG